MYVLFTLGNSSRMTKGKWYVVIDQWIDKYGDWYEVICDNGEKHSVCKRYFTTQQQHRNNNLDIVFDLTNNS
jgi:hypothetical protein